MGLFCIHPLRNEAETFSYSEDMSVNGKGLSSHAEEQETVNRFRANPFEAFKSLLDLFRTHLLQKEEVQLPFPFFNPSEDIEDASRLLLGQTTRPNGLNDRPSSCLEDVFPIRESGLQPLIGPIPISVVGIL